MNSEHQQVSSKLIKITGMSLLFMTIELVGGYLANSIAIFADAFHLLSDVFAYLISLGAVWLSTRPNSPKQLTFGWEKAQPLGALINVAIIYVVTAELFIEATKRMLNKETVDEPLFMLLTSIFGLICNLIIMQILHNDPHGGHQCSHGHGHEHEHEHGHGHTHQHNHTHEHNDSTKDHIATDEDLCGYTHDRGCNDRTHKHYIKTDTSDKNSNEELHDTIDNTRDPNSPKTSIDNNVLSVSNGSDEQIRQNSNEREKKIKDINLEAAYIHILTDIILSIGVIISALVIYFMCPEKNKWTVWQLADPLCTYLFSFLAIYSTWPILKEAVFLLLDASHDEQLVNQIQKDIKNMHEVVEVVDLKIWSTNRNKHYGAVKVRIEAGRDARRVKKMLEIRKVHGFVDMVEEEVGLTEQC